MSVRAGGEARRGHRLGAGRAVASRPSTAGAPGLRRPARPIAGRCTPASPSSPHHSPGRTGRGARGHPRGDRSGAVRCASPSRHRPNSTVRPPSGPPGGTVARAKRTDRAEARRRYRAAMAEAGTRRSGSRPGSTPRRRPDRRDPRLRRRSTTGSASGPAPMQRPGIAYAFRTAFRPADLRGDLRPCRASCATRPSGCRCCCQPCPWRLIPIFGATSLTVLFYQYFSGTAPLGTSFIAGFFAPRASYLLGGSSPSPRSASRRSRSSVRSARLLRPQRPGDRRGRARDILVQQILTNALFAGVPSGAFFAAAAAWYRRFLRLASPNRQAPGPARPASGPTARSRRSSAVPPDARPAPLDRDGVRRR